MAFPEEIFIYLVDEENGAPIEGVVFIVKLFSKDRYDFYIVTEKTDDKGYISLSIKDIYNKLNKSLHPEDPLQDYRSLVMIWIMSCHEIQNILDSVHNGTLSPFVSITSLKDMQCSKNDIYQERSGMYEFSSEKTIQIYITTKKK
jgi:hypothetical protein